MARPTIPLRLDPDCIELADALAARMTDAAGGIKITRSEVLRRAVERGLVVLEKEFPAKRSRKR
jgi:predicted transcriptional regulator